MIATIIGFSIIFVIGELIAAAVFAALRNYFDVFAAKEEFAPDLNKTPVSPTIEAVKGILERLVVTFGLFISLPGILTVFAALKLANRLNHEDDDSDRTKNYFLIGNLLTVLFCLVYYQIAVVFAETIGAAMLNLIPL